MRGGGGARTPTAVARVGTVWIPANPAGQLSECDRDSAVSSGPSAGSVDSSGFRDRPSEYSSDSAANLGDDSSEDVYERFLSQFRGDREPKSGKRRKG